MSQNDGLLSLLPFLVKIRCQVLFTNLSGADCIQCETNARILERRAKTHALSLHWRLLYAVVVALP
jgi:hypothetical protein